MAGKNNIYNQNDSMDINELASLDEEISPELIEQLQMKLSKEANQFTGGSTTPAPISSSVDDASLFEEPPASLPAEENSTVAESVAELPTDNIPTIEEPVPTEGSELAPDEDTVTETVNNNETPSLEELASANAGRVKKEDVNIEENFDDNFIKKYKAKLKKQSKNANEESSDKEFNPIEKLEESSVEEDENVKITEKVITKEQKEYNQSLDLLDGNVKYSKYVIYIDPENVDFIEGLTVKERKNLVNNILKNQNDISVTKQRLKIIQSVIMHLIVMILTIAISIPVIYYVINASLETTINNYRRSQTNFQVLYKEKGKITNIKR